MIFDESTRLNSLALWRQTKPKRVLTAVFMKKLRVIIWNLVNFTAALRSAAIFTPIHLVFCYVYKAQWQATSGCTRTVKRVYSNKRLHLILALCSSTRRWFRLIGSLLFGLCFIETMRDAARIPVNHDPLASLDQSLHSLCCEHVAERKISDASW